MQYPNLIGPTFVPGKGIQAPVVFFDDFFGDQPVVSKSALAAPWLQTDETGTSVLGIAVADADGGAFEFDTGTTAASDVSIQLQDEPFLMNTGRHLYFESKLKVETVALSSAMFGMSVIDATPFAGFPANFVGFTMDTDADLEIRSIASAGGDSGDLDTGTDLVADTYVTLGMQWDGTSKVHFFADGVHVYTYSTLANIPYGVNLTPLFGIKVTSTTAAKLTIDYVYVMNDRD